MSEIREISFRLGMTGDDRVESGFRRVKVASEQLESQYQKLSSTLASWAKIAAAAAGAFAGWKTTEWIRDAMMLAARVDTLGVVMKVVGNNAGYTSAQMDAYAKQVQKMGITTQESRNSLIQMAAAQMDLSKASQLARVAQDAAVIGGINSSEAFSRMIQGIRSGEVEVLRTIGINVSFEQSYARLAIQLKKNAADLTENEKMTARLTAVLDYGKNIAGAYEASLGTAGKQLLSMARYTEELKLKIGQTFNPVLTAMVMDLVKALEALNRIGGNSAAERDGFGQWLSRMYDLTKREGNMVMGWLDRLNAGLYRFLQLGAEAQSVTPFGGTGVGKTIEEAGYRMGGRVDQLERDYQRRQQAIGEYDARYRTGAMYGEGTMDAKDIIGSRKPEIDLELKRIAAGEAARKEQAKLQAAQQAAKYAEEWKNTLGDLRNEIANTNPYIDQHQKELNNVANKYDELFRKKGADIALLQKLKQERIDGLNAVRAMNDAIKATSDYFQEYQRLAEAEPPQHGGLGGRLQTWEQELDLVKSLQPTAEIDQLNEQLATFLKMLLALPERASEIEAAMQTIRQQLRAVTDNKFEDLQIAGINDPYEQQMAQLEARYRREKQLIRENVKYMKEGSAEQIKTVRALAQLEQNEAAETAKVKWAFWRDSLGFYSNILGQMSGLIDTNSRNGFEASKAFAMGSTLMNTAASVMSQTAGPDGWTPAAWGRAIAVGLVGAAQLAKIASTTYGGGGSIGGVSAGFSSSGASGGIGGGAVGSSIGAPTTSIHDSQTQAALNRLAESSDNASLAIGRVADGLTKIGDLFGEGSSGKLLAGGLTSPEYYTPPGILGHSWADFKKNWNAMFVKPDFATLLTTPFAPITGALNTLFGWGNDWYTKASGIRLGLAGGRLSALGYTERQKDGGWFTSDEHATDYSALDPLISSSLNGFLNRVTQSVIRSAAVMGTTANIPGVTLPSTNIQTSGRKPEDIQKDLEEWFTKAADAIGQSIEGLKKFTPYGESAFDAAVRLSTSLQGVNEKLSLIGATLIDSTLQGANAAYQLQNLMGGLDKFNDSVGDYVKAMYTEAEQKQMEAAAAQREVNVAFSEMVLSVPKTREEFRSLVNGLDLTTDNGRSLFASLMDVAGAFGTVQDQAEEMAKAVLESHRDLQNRYLRVTGQDMQASLYEMANSQADELKEYVSKGLDITRLLYVQQLEFAKAAGEYLLESQERLRQALLEQERLQLEEANTAVSRLTDTVNTLKQQTVATLGSQITILQTLQRLSTDTNLSVLSPEARYQQLRQSFADTAARAPQDAQALASISEIAQQLAAASRGYYASGPGYQQDMTYIQETLARLAGLDSAPSVTEAERQIEALTTIRDELNKGAIVQGLGDLTKAMIQLSAAQNSAKLMELKLAYDKAVGEKNSAQGAKDTAKSNLENFNWANLSGPFATDTAGMISWMARGQLPNPYGFTTDDAYLALRHAQGLSNDPTAWAGFMQKFSAYNTAYSSTLLALQNSVSAAQISLDSATARALEAYSAWQAALNSMPKYATGGIAYSASIFGEAGPEAAVPLPDGRSIPVNLRMSDNYAPVDLSELIAEVKELRREVAELKGIGAAGVRVAQAGHTATIEKLEEGNAQRAGIGRTAKMAGAKP